MACNPNTVLEAGKDFQRLSDRDLIIAQCQLMRDYVTAVSPGTDVTLAAIVLRAKDFQALDDQELRIAIISLLCTISGG